MSLIYVKRKSVDLTKLNGTNEVQADYLHTKHLITENVSKRKQSYETAYEEIIKLEQPDVEPIPQENHTKFTFWGFMILKCLYNKNRENITVNFTDLKPLSSYWKAHRKHEFIIKVFGRNTGHWESGEFILDEMNPPNSIWIIENLLAEKIKKIHLKIKVFRTRKYANKRLLGEGEIQLTELCTTNQTVRIPLETIYQDKPEKLFQSTKINKSVEKTDVEKDEVDCNFDGSSIVEINCCDLVELIPEILVGMEYNHVKSMLFLKIEKCFHLFYTKADKINILEIYVKCILEPENFKCSTRPSSKTHCPILKESFQIPILKDNLELGKFTFFIISKKTNKKLFTVAIDRKSDEFWKEIITVSKEMIYRWLELTQVK